MDFSRFFEIPSDVTAWQLLNSQFLATAMGALVAVAVARYGKRAADSAADAAASQNAQIAVREAAEIEASEASDAQLAGAPQELPRPGEQDWRVQSKAIVETAKAFIDQRVADEPDGRYRRTYEAIPSSDYLALAVALHTRRRLTDDEFAAASSIFTGWRMYERGRASKKVVPQAVHDLLRNNVRQLARPS